MMFTSSNTAAKAQDQVADTIVNETEDETSTLQLFNLSNPESEIDAAILSWLKSGISE